MTRPVPALDDQELVALFAGEPELLALCDAIRETRPAPSRRPRRAVFAFAVAAVLLAIAAPAVAITRGLIDFSTAPGASSRTLVAFDELSLGAPAGMDPRAMAANARSLTGGDLADGRRYTLSLAPTREGGFCYVVSIVDLPTEVGCDARRELGFAPGYSAARLPGPVLVTGSVLDPAATIVEVVFVDGTRASTELVRVSQPIDASFFVVSGDALPRTAILRDAAGRQLAARRFPAPPLP